MYPDFIGIGAQKAGTTWLHRNLQAHPQIWMPRKEIHYFNRKINEPSVVARIFGKRQVDRQWRRQVRFWVKRHLLQEFSLGELAWDFKYYLRPYSDRWYGSIFEPKRGRKAGEITPAYSVLDKDRVAHIHSLVPEAKIIFMVRNPIERAWSHAVMSFDKEAKGSAELASEAELRKRAERDSTYLLTDYLGILQNWGAFFPQDQIFVGFLEDIHFNPEELLHSVFGFLGVDSSFRPPKSDKKIHSRSAATMPTRLAAHLASTYQDELARLEERFGGYASFWRYCGDRLAEQAIDEDKIPYPLWDSFLWEEWKTSEYGMKEIGLRSGPLPALQAVR